MRWIKKLDRAPLTDSLIQFARLVGREQAGGRQGNMHTWNEEARKVRGEKFTWREEGRRRGGRHGIVTCGCAGGHSDAIESVYYPGNGVSLSPRLLTTDLGTSPTPRWTWRSAPAFPWLAAALVPHGSVSHWARDLGSPFLHGKSSRDPSPPGSQFSFCPCSQLNVADTRRSCPIVKLNIVKVQVSSSETFLGFSLSSLSSSFLTLTPNVSFLPLSSSLETDCCRESRSQTGLSSNPCSVS